MKITKTNLKCNKRKYQHQAFPLNLENLKLDEKVIKEHVKNLYQSRATEAERSSAA